jgi:hypothetical protein
MDWSDFQRKGYELTQSEIDVLSRQVIEQYQLGYDAISTDLEKQYAKLLTGVRPEDYYNEMMKFNRLQKLQSEVATLYKTAAGRANLLIENASFVGMSNSYYRAQYEASWMAQFEVGLLPKDLAEFTVYGTESSWKAITARVEALYGDATLYKSQSGTLIRALTQNMNADVLKIQNAITQGLLQGKGYPFMAKSIRDIIGKQMVKDGIYTLQGAMANAMRIIRTESNRTMNAGHYASSKYLDSLGIEVQRRLVSVLDKRTRGQSARMDGQTVGVDEPFKYPGGATALYPGNTGVPAYDINDRETTIDIIDGNEPELRTGRNPVTGKSETFNYKNFDDWRKENGLIKNKYGEILFPES